MRCRFESGVLVAVAGKALERCSFAVETGGAKRSKIEGTVGGYIVGGVPLRAVELVPPSSSCLGETPPFSRV